MEAADAALYELKSQGGNRIIVEEPAVAKLGTLARTAESENLR